jgi:hypothetical protein
MSAVTDLSARYGRPSASRTRVVVAVAVVLVGVALSWLAWVILEQGRPEVQSALVSFEARTEHAAVATFSVVRRSAEVEASCLLQARAADHTVVGELNVTVGPGAPTTSTETQTVRTERRATTVDVLGCTAPGQNERR